MREQANEINQRKGEIIHLKRLVEKQRELAKKQNIDFEKKLEMMNQRMKRESDSKEMTDTVSLYDKINKLEVTARNLESEKQEKPAMKPSPPHRPKNWFLCRASR